ncbi:uncharacterized protein BXZ73DRAFT_75827 [Epithele typhae]|uniref:uncharacterized protein n=1 Tax=Epithele typhae TaxID=378194 RepID=UPI00200810A0|nr:uncharacterized protein BXZ73DRAFT_75827 [Epithele typhae]KAH9939621.1 hypothetical protein BXZ73DRAFT_75827 [Epithele typhae]
MGRRNTNEFATTATRKPLRVVANGTLFLTTNLGLPTHPEPNAAVRAHSVARVRGGSASTCLSIVAQFPAVEAHLVAPLGGNEEGRQIIKELEAERVTTRYCKVWPESGVPSAWVLHADDTDSRTVINNNPLPDITHEEFISLTGPLLVPENYQFLNGPPVSPPPAPIQQFPVGSVSGATGPRPSTSGSGGPNAQQTSRIPIPNSPAPIDWIHFEGRSVKTTLNNVMGLDGLARERKWRSHCVFSLDVGRRARQGVEALMPHVDVIFLNRHYACALSSQYASAPRAFLLALAGQAPPHALLVAHWGADGAAVLSVPTREYFQASAWAEPAVPTPAPAPPDPASLSRASGLPLTGDVQSVRSGSDYFAGGHQTDTSSMFTADLLRSPPPPPQPREQDARPGPSQKERQKERQRQKQKQKERRQESDSDSDSDGTQIAGQGGGVRPALDAAARARAAQAQQSKEMLDEVGAHDAFVAGMMWALTRRLLPGEPYTPAARQGGSQALDMDGKGRWRLEECLRFATELAGRKGRRKGWAGLANEMLSAGWFEA